MNSAESRIINWSFGLLGLWLGMVQVAAADLAEVQAQLRTGDYQGAMEAAQAETSKPRNRSEEWPLLWVESLMMTGKYPEAHAVLTNALARHPRSIRLRWVGREVVRYNSHPELAQEYLNDIRTLVSGRQSNYTDPADFLIVGAVALLSGADPKDVLRRVYDPIQKADATLRDVYLARGELALSKHDFDLAAKAFASGLKQHPDDADFHYGMALAFADGDREQMGESLESALKHNSKHLPSLLLLADHKIDAEDYTSATKLLDEVSKVNPWHPDAWAYRAVLAHLKNDLPSETAARESGLRYWTNNPRVDHLIGKKLSQKYRFQEGAVRQRSALAMDAAYLPAKSQLASDLLRLGNDPEGWRLAQEVHQTDGYDVSAFNLVTLHDTMARFVTLTNQYFAIRMHPREADIYGPRVLAFLTRARERLVAKYGLSIQDPTTVEIFSEQKDFGVRTFGIPDNPGYLGVCFGRVITANSPGATKGMPVNWEAVLWHEFCHVVTLQLTANRMPRWLSEGISVFEELEENKAWGQRMTPRYRDMILNGDLTPISKLSGAFLAPKTPFHLQFAYYESSLVVEFLVKRFGIEKLRAILADLKTGIGINESISRQTAPMDALEKEFSTFAMARARALGPGLDWEKPKSEGPMSLGGPTLAKWAQNRPTNYYAMMQRAQQLVSAKQWTEAKEPLQKLVELYPDQTGKDSAYPVLAQVHRMLGETNDERRVLSRYADEDDEASEAYLRLAELGVAGGDWEEVRRNSQRFLSVNPLVATPYRYLARAAEALGDVPVAISAHKTLLKLDPPNPSEVHYHLARLLKRTGDPEARQQVLLALEDAPRHRAALRLLLELQGASAKSGEVKP